MSSSSRRQALPSKAEMQARSARRNAIAVLSLAALAIIVVVAIVLYQRGAVQKSASIADMDAQLTVGQTAPPFDVATTNGPFSLATNGAGKPTLLEVFATWCPHCQREAPVLSAIARAYAGRANVVGVSGSPLGMDQNAETQNDVYQWTQKFGASYPVAFDPNLDVAKKYLQGGFPTVVLIGANGKVQAIGSGEIAPAALQHALSASLAGQPPNPTFAK